MEDHITFVKGFKWGSASVGLKTGGKDVAVIYSEKPAQTAAVYTKNRVIAEPLKITQKHLENGVSQAIVVNSGNANACTGQQGYDHAVAMAQSTAGQLNIDPHDVIVASTGVIGEPFPVDKVKRGITNSINGLSYEKEAGTGVAEAILTTDTKIKTSTCRFRINGVEVRMSGIAKGSGMIHPDMGTMLAFIFCDAAIEKAVLDSTFKKAVDVSFNMVSVDGDTSTNDMATIMCNGMAGNKMLESADDPGFAEFKDALTNLCIHLAKQIVEDGEGITKFIEYKVVHAGKYEDAKKIIRTISDSSLVKTAFFGNDPNWGRIIAAAGRAGVELDIEKTDLYIGQYKLLEKGKPIAGNREKAKAVLQAPKIFITLDLNAGNAEAVGWGSDLSVEYVRFNAEYTT
jgi:glutamate N-acetyltransferase/amino-acid N-acetyltransferase